MSLIYLLMLLLGALGLPSTDAPDPVHATDVEVMVGQSETVTLGPGNDSIGHGYYIVDGEDNPYATLEMGGTDVDPLCEPGGCNYTHYVEVTGIAPGSFEFTVQYCFRSDPTNCDTDGEAPVTYTVTVRE